MALNQRESLRLFQDLQQSEKTGVSPVDQQLQDFLEKAQHWIWDGQKARNRQLKLGGAYAFYGKELRNRAEIDINAKILLDRAGFPDDAEDLVSTSGFPVLRQMEPGLTDDEYMLSEMLAINQLVPDALTEIGFQPQDIDLVLVATSIPLAPDFSEYWKQAAGIPQGVPTIPFCMACNSSGRAMAELLSGSFDDKLQVAFGQNRPARIALIALDDANRLSDLGGDPRSVRLFSTATSTVAWEYHPTLPSSMKLICHTSASIERGTQYLKVFRPHDQWTPEQRQGIYFAQHLQAPEPGEGFINLHPKAGGAFLSGGMQVAKEGLAQYEAAGFNASHIRKIIMHHPSRVIFDHMVEKLIKLNKGFRADQFHWVINEGNVPVCTIPIGFCKEMADLNPGDHVAFVSYGAGGEYTFFVVEMGGSEKSVKLDPRRVVPDENSAA